MKGKDDKFGPSTSQMLCANHCPWTIRTGKWLARLPTALTNYTELVGVAESPSIADSKLCAPRDS